ncbi:MAG: SusC/RagA family TonB-linked outer membrane protein [Phaeodactylibacter sp.]|nr:SusC/RagA family TonB-linked outer membrane protein [Phaeodactylibacter sp.]
MICRKWALLVALAAVLGFPLQAQVKTVRGTVTDAKDKSPLIGVNVAVKGQQRGAITDMDGKYSLEASPGDSLLFSYIGYSSQSIAVGAEDILDIALVEQGALLDQVVVTALSIEREKEKVGYSISQVDAPSLLRTRELNVVNALSGKVAGLQVDAGPVPGSSSKINLRGIRFINQDNGPLIIVDGIPINSDIDAFEEQEFFGLGGQDFGNGLTELNPEDIENISVLKGITAAALYGSRGANGVIIVTTKKGRATKGLGISLNSSFLVDEPFRWREVQNEYGQGESGAWLPLTDNGDGTFRRQFVNFWQSGNSWGPRLEGQPVKWEDGQVKPYEPLPDNYKDPVSNGYQANTSLYFSGASEYIRFRGGFSYANTDRIFPNSNLQRLSLKAKTNAYISDNFSIETTTVFSQNENNNPPVLGNSERSFGKNWLYNWNRSMRPDVLSNFRQGPDGQQFVNIGVRGWEYYKEVLEDRISDKTDRLIGGFSLKYEITDWLRLTARAGLDYRVRQREFRIAKNEPGSFTGRYDTGKGVQQQLNLEALLSFHKKISPAFTLGASVGASEWAQKDEFLSFSTQNKGLTKENIFHVSAVNIQLIDEFAELGISQDIYRKTIRSTFGFLDVSYKDQLNLQLTGRNDWSSALPLDNNDYFYPSANASWQASNTLDLPSFINRLVLRASWAQVRTDEAPFLLDITYAESSRLGQYSALLAERNIIPPADLKPSQLNEAELGLNLQLWENRAGLDLTLYRSNASRQSILAPVPLSSGFNFKRFNTAEIQNQGIEAALLLSPVAQTGLSWDVNLNFTLNRNEVLKVSDEVDRVSLGRFAPGTEYVWAEVQAVVGQPYGVILNNDYVYSPEGAPVINPDGTWKQTEAIVPVGNIQPDFLLGLTNTFSYKGLQLAFLLDGKFGQEAYWGTKDWAERLGQDAATLEGRDAAHGGLAWVDANGNERDDGVILPGVKEVFDAEGNAMGYEPNDIIVSAKERWSTQPHAANVLDGSFFRFRELSLSYTLSARQLERLPFTRLSVSLIGRNLFYVYSALPGNYNPEAVVSKQDEKQGIEFGALPGIRSYGVSLGVGF